MRDERKGPAALRGSASGGNNGCAFEHARVDELSKGAPRGENGFPLRQSASGLVWPIVPARIGIAVARRQRRLVREREASERKLQKARRGWR
jgi:hypothetical protein